MCVRHRVVSRLRPASTIPGCPIVPNVSLGIRINLAKGFSPHHIRTAHGEEEEAEAVLRRREHSDTTPQEPIAASTTRSPLYSHIGIELSESPLLVM